MAETEMEPEEYVDQPLRWYVIAVYMLTVVAGFAFGVVGTLGWYNSCDEGRHVSPFVAGDSLRGTLCESGHGAAGLLVPGGWLIGLALATLALMRWGRGLRRAVLLGVLLLTPMALPPAAYAGLRLSSTTCDHDKMQAYDAWVEKGSKGAAPYNCRTF
jgi:hypothetical protein